jgi:DNA-binding GntR family transcriptional regulator
MGRSELPRHHLEAIQMKHGTLTDSIVFTLCDDIICKRLEPGSELDEGRLGKRFGASRTPVREALRALAASGLVELRPHAAPRIASVDEVRLREMFEVMTELEALCASLAAANMDPGQRAGLDQHHRQMGEAVREGDVKRYGHANVIFHEMIYTGSGNSYLRNVTLATRIRLGPYRSAQLEAPARMAASYSEHYEILTAILQADGLRAAQAMRVHLSTTRDAIGLIVQSKKMPNK